MLNYQRVYKQQKHVGDVIDHPQLMGNEKWSASTANSLVCLLQSICSLGLP
jgi:hypothetical protein